MSTVQFKTLNTLWCLTRHLPLL